MRSGAAPNRRRRTPHTVSQAVSAASSISVHGHPLDIVRSAGRREGCAGPTAGAQTSGCGEPADARRPRRSSGRETAGPPCHLGTRASAHANESTTQLVLAIGRHTSQPTAVPVTVATLAAQNAAVCASPSANAFWAARRTRATSIVWSRASPGCPAVRRPATVASQKSKLSHGSLLA